MKPINWEQARIYMDLAKSHHEHGEESSSYLALFKYFECIWRPNTTTRQKEQHRLFRELGTLHRTQHNLRTVFNLSSPDVKFNYGNYIGNTEEAIKKLIAERIKLLTTIKERIPAND